MSATFLRTDQILRPVAAELGLLEKGLRQILSADLSLLAGIGEHLLAIKGKRVRPLLLFLASRAGSPDPELTVRAGIAVELIHTATLLHDDSIDRSNLRRGLPTVNRLWNDQVSVIMGDHLFCKAFRLLHESGLEEIAHVLVHGSDRMTFGEMYQMDRRGDFGISRETYMDVIREKTAALFASACEAGAVLGGVPPEGRENLRAFGEKVGTAFQVVDDVLDFTGDVGRMGKPVGNDIRDGRVTLPLIIALRNAPPGEAAAVISDIERAGAAGADWDRMVQFIIANGGVEASREVCRGLIEDAKSSLSGFEKTPAVKSLGLLADYVISRQQ
jgi:octaprenyl-diphosphate synthase